MMKTNKVKEIPTPLPEPEVLKNAKAFFSKCPVELKPNMCSWYMAYTDVFPAESRMIPSPILSPGSVLMKRNFKKA
jgi:hypothetical protein